MRKSPVAKLYAEWRAHEDHLNTLDTQGEISAGLEKQFRRERRMLVARSKTLADLAMKLITLTDEVQSELGDRLDALVEEAKEIIGRSERPGTLERSRRWAEEKAEAARVAA
jgi:hypothetical protein